MCPLFPKYHFDVHSIESIGISNKDCCCKGNITFEDDPIYPNELISLISDMPNPNCETLKHAAADYLKSDIDGDKSMYDFEKLESDDRNDPTSSQNYLTHHADDSPMSSCESSQDHGSDDASLGLEELENKMDPDPVTGHVKPKLLATSNAIYSENFKL